uniref:Cyclin N-terminal domain-containing protein n=1 Tax=Grammatophora oceanica TaxID=210454 RepID=A0A7S1UN00_9STRA|eukprot:CAMPEP_0194048602 /NCGR_PEP_ID=MMETSP0009_2-20130614/27822_1 /TAXON_ID=210454 /ORGANISM="Grammatophora oceanica, Strain CCMP 410" /LENGTH=386 /DNA_ID=CAMNT_0038694521 /DNA_START=128 /DNA_END=1288 /DNA_ORIENTATION=+
MASHNHHSISPIVYYSPDAVVADEQTLDDQRSDIDAQVATDDQLEALLQIERTYCVQQVQCRNPSASHPPHDEWRRKITEWSYRVVDHFRIDREVVLVAMNYFDRFLALHSTSSANHTCQCPACQRAVDSRTFQLAAMTCLYLAIKLHAESLENTDGRTFRGRKIKISSFVDLSRGQFTAEDLASMERIILATLQWKVNPPTSSLLVTYLLRLMPSQVAYPTSLHYDLVLHVLKELARYLSELSVCTTNLSISYLPSEVAYAAIMVSMDLLNLQALPLDVQHSFCSSVAAMSGMDLRDDKIRCLMDHLRQCFWPEMLVEEEDMDCDHPIAMAKAAGLLDISHLTGPTKQQVLRNNSATSVMQVEAATAVTGTVMLHDSQATYVVTP